jgi:soluble lytic murein transglycosylase-like protein
VRSLRNLVLLALVSAALPAVAADIAVLRNGFEIRHLRREAAGDKTRLYVSSEGYVEVPTAQIQRIEREEYAYVEPAPDSPTAAATTAPDLHLLTSAAAGRHQVDQDFIEAVIRAESAGNPRARSPKGAQGLMQLMPSTADRLGVRDAFDPASNVEGGTRHLRALLELYNGDAVKALAAYNAGTERVAQYRGVPPYPETRAYVRRVIADYNAKKLTERKAPARTKPQKQAAAPAGN